MAKAVRKQTGRTITFLKQRGSVMLITILNSIYREFLRSSLSGMAVIQGSRP
jgi:hypothetical protein